jgi:hypothetical protein
MPLPEARRRELDELGFTRLAGFIEPSRREQLARRLEQLFEAEGERAGSEFRQEEGARRLANLADKGALFLDCALEPAVLEHVAHVLGAGFKLSSLNARSASPHNGAPQPLHVDAGALPDARGYWVCNTVWLLDDFTRDNGALRVVPGSHRSGHKPQEVLADPLAPHPDERLVTGRAGDLLVMNAHLWHAGTANATARARLALHAFYCRSDKPQQQYQKGSLRPETLRALSPAARALLAIDDPDNDALAATGAGRSGFLR